MSGLSRDAQAQTRRLLRVLFLWQRKVSAAADSGRLVLQIAAQAIGEVQFRDG